MWHPVWEPFWQAVNDVNLPLHFHTFPSLNRRLADQYQGLTRRVAIFTSVAGFQMNLINILAAVIGGAARTVSQAAHRASARAASAGSPTCSTAWTSNTRTASSDYSPSR